LKAEAGACGGVDARALRVERTAAAVAKEVEGRVNVGGPGAVAVARNTLVAVLAVGAAAEPEAGVDVGQHGAIPSRGAVWVH